MDIFYDWNYDSMLEVTLPDPDAFLKVCETLTRIGIASKKDTTLPFFKQYFAKFEVNLS